ncbi:hypothetical protein OW763_05380 [Clostridium aestuarii]|uniref:Uncharacterized protein n=1 Tax=Clostridium aestuarii TaxID=338193 RepID=A0ABT4CXT5_9CLOT|nr:hypothetical protein [Clostridium aestuarii]MCY6483781.1 hypothetical protein [Clostridium aestuarii]
MGELIIQYVLIVFLVVGLAYFVYLLKDKGIKITEDYFGIAYTMLGFLENNEATTENQKKILRTISEIVNYVEVNYTNQENSMKEEKALVLAREAMDSLNLKNKIEEHDLRRLIRLCSGFMPSTNKIFRSEKLKYEKEN